MFRQNSIPFIADENGVIHIPEQISNLSMIPLNFEGNQNIQEEPTNITPETLFEHSTIRITKMLLNLNLLLNRLLLKALTRILQINMVVTFYLLLIT
ncbi:MULTISPECIES: hypothetical protein [unclassified Rickettsia]|uniref:hypothetical protein n=1 Tax=unclassified Rickettsia TaxID=114295 RepID=UPI0031329F7D